MTLPLTEDDASVDNDVDCCGPLDGPIDPDDLEEEYLTSSLFVANLPSVEDNVSLAWDLYRLFSNLYGPVVKVKASRDLQKRPFGFVTFAYPQSCWLALQHGHRHVQLGIADASPVAVGRRRLRLELAKRQCKLIVKWTGDADALPQRRSLLEHVTRCKTVCSVSDDAAGDDDSRHKRTAWLSAIVRFGGRSRLAARCMHAWAQTCFPGHLGWSLWIANSDDDDDISMLSRGEAAEDEQKKRAAAAANGCGKTCVRPSGLVQLYFPHPVCPP